MGHLINPISTRLSFTSFWLSSWTDFLKKDFSYNLMADKGLSALVDWIFIHSWFAQLLTKNGIFLSHYRIIRRGVKFRVHCFLVYNSALLLKSSFVESYMNSVGLESVEFLLKKNLKNKRSLGLLKSSILKNLNTINSLKLVNQVEAFFNRFSAGSSSSTNLTTRRITSVAKREVSNKNLLYLIRLKKLYLSLIINSLSVYFSNVLSSLFTAFWFKLKVLNREKTTITVGVRFLDNFNLINPQFLARFIARRVTYGFQLQRVVKPLIKDLLSAILKKKNKIVGFRIACSGRFDRKQIASYVWQKFGPVSLNKFSCNINYGFSTAYLKYGTCGIKVWVASEHKVIKSQKNISAFRSLFSNKLAFLFQNETFKQNPSNFLKLVTVLNSFNLFEKKVSKSFNKKDLTSLNFELFLRLQLLAVSWLRYENGFLKKLK